MYPWLWFWAPQIHFPFSGALSQTVEPNTSWYFGAIAPRAGNGAMEEHIATDVASYGRQLGLITEVLLSLTNGDTIDAKKAEESLKRLKKIYHEIEQAKSADESRNSDMAISLLNRLRESDAKQFARVLEHFQARDN